MSLEIGLQEICQKQAFDELRFWGRIRGKESNYYIAVAFKFTEFEFPAKKFWFATSNFVFTPLPKLIPLFAAKLEELNQPFAGTPEATLFEVTETVIEEIELEQVEALIQAENEAPKPDLEQEEEEEPVEQAPEPARIEKRVTERQVVCKEVDWLGCVVRAIEFECACLPKGALKVSISHQLRYNKGFVGLRAEEALDAANWLHFRQPMTDEGVQIIRRPDAIFESGFLENIKEDLPRRCWSIQLDLRKEMVC